MTAVLLALVAAVAYGTSDFVGGVLSRSRSAWMVAVASQVVSAVATAVAGLVLAGAPDGADLAWAAAGGVGEGIGIGFLYRGLGRGRMGVVAPISGIGAALVPVVVGVVTGDQPSPAAWVGIVLAFPAIYFIPRTPSSGAPGSGTGSGTGAGSTAGSRAESRAGVADGIVAGLGFGAQFALVGQIGERAGLLPLALLWLVSAVTVVALATVVRASWRPRGPGLGRVFAFGVISAVAVVSFLLATGQGLLAVVSVVAALYPGVTVVLAAAILRERIGRFQLIGLGLAVASVVLVTLGR